MHAQGQSPSSSRLVLPVAFRRHGDARPGVPVPGARVQVSGFGGTPAPGPPGPPPPLPLACMLGACALSPGVSDGMPSGLERGRGGAMPTGRAGPSHGKARRGAVTVVPLCHLLPLLVKFTRAASADGRLSHLSSAAERLALPRGGYGTASTLVQYAHKIKARPS